MKKFILLSLLLPTLALHGKDYTITGIVEINKMPRSLEEIENEKAKKKEHLSQLTRSGRVAPEMLKEIESRDRKSIDAISRSTSTSGVFEMTFIEKSKTIFWEIVVKSEDNDNAYTTTTVVASPKWMDMLTEKDKRSTSINRSFNQEIGPYFHTAYYINPTSLVSLFEKKESDSKSEALFSEPSPNSYFLSSVNKVKHYYNPGNYDFPATTTLSRDNREIGRIFAYFTVENPHYPYQISVEREKVGVPGVTTSVTLSHIALKNPDMNIINRKFKWTPGTLVVDTRFKPSIKYKHNPSLTDEDIRKFYINSPGAKVASKKTKGPILGVVAGIIGLTMLIWGIILYRKTDN